jgi:hypothetical protein
MFRRTTESSASNPTWRHLSFRPAEQPWAVRLNFWDLADHVLADSLQPVVGRASRIAPTGIVFIAV